MDVIRCYKDGEPFTMDVIRPKEPFAMWHVIMAGEPFIMNVIRCQKARGTLCHVAWCHKGRGALHHGCHMMSQDVIRAGEPFTIWHAVIRAPLAMGNPWSWMSQDVIRTGEPFAISHDVIKAGKGLRQQRCTYPRNGKHGTFFSHCLHIWSVHH